MHRRLQLLGAARHRPDGEAFTDDRSNGGGDEPDFAASPRSDAGEELAPGGDPEFEMAGEDVPAGGTVDEPGGEALPAGGTVDELGSETLPAGATLDELGGGAGMPPGGMFESETEFRPSGRRWAAGSATGGSRSLVRRRSGPAADWGRSTRLRWDPGRPGAAALAAVALVSAVLSATITWISRPTPQPVPVPVMSASPAPSAAGSDGGTGFDGGTGDQVGDGARSGTGGGSGPSAVAAAQTVVVAVVGQVAAPGLVTLPAGSRVDDALAAAGGPLPDADLTTVNLARVVADGEQIAVGVPGAAPGPSAEPGAAGSTPVNLNTASEQDLETLPGVGPVLAGRIVLYRSDSGGFTSVDQLQDVSGIGPTTFAELQDLVTV